MSESIPHAKPAPQSPFPDVPRKNIMELRLREFKQLFNTFDPAPFIEKDLNQDAEEFLISWAREMPRGQPLGLVVHLDQSEGNVDVVEVMTTAIHNFFAYRARLKRQDLSEFFRQANMSLLIGLIVLIVCMIASLRAGESWGDTTAGSLVSEGLLIAGWVAMWKPLELFLYEWWPIRRRVRLLNRLSVMPIRVMTRS